MPPMTPPLGRWCAAACGLLSLIGCVYQPLSSGSRVVDPALLALGDSDRSLPADSPDDVKYMFCIPDTAMIRAEVTQIDASIRFYNDERAKRVCGSHMLVCVGSACQTGFMSILDRLSKKPYITSIDLATSDFYH